MPITLEQLQTEVKPWHDYNFPNAQSWMPLLGMIEELGELDAAYDGDQVMDAVGDTMIFMVDYLNQMGMTFADVLACKTICTVSLLHLCGILCHAHLKWAQKIRASENIHLGAIMCVLKSIICYLQETYVSNHAFLYDIESVWNRVKIRDWQKDPMHGITTTVED